MVAGKDGWLDGLDSIDVSKVLFNRLSWGQNVT